MFGSKGLRVALAVPVLVVLAQSMAGAADAPRLTKPVNATKNDVSPGRTYSAPFLAVDPSNKKIIVGGFIEFRSRTCGLVRSTDGGATWKILDSAPDLSSYPYCLANNSNIFHAPVAFGRNGTLYLATHAWDTPDSRNKEGVQVARSTDLGDHWTTVIARDARPTAGDTQENDRPITGMVVDSKHGSQDIIYVTLRQNFPNTAAPNAKPAQPVVLISRDGGKTFAPPVTITGTFFNDNGSVVNQALTTRTTVANTTTTTAPANTLGANPANPANFGSAGNGQGLTIDNKGNLYYGWMYSSSNVTPSVPSGILLSKSTDQGKTWKSTVVQPPSYQNRQNVRLAWSPGGSQGTLHMVWEGSQHPEVNSFAETMYSRSTDGGNTWSAPTRLSDTDPAKLVGNYLPNVTVAPNGRIDVAFWDTRDDPGIRSNDVYYTYSNDDGKTWSKNIRITDQTVDRRFGVWGNNFDQNSPPSLTSTNEYAMFAWDDTRLSRGDGTVGVSPADPTVSGGIGGGVQDIFTAAYQFKALGGGTSKAAKGVIAGVIGLVAVGLALIIAALVTRGRRRDGTPSARQTGARPAAEVK